jgi:hypothetical protein
MDFEDYRRIAVAIRNTAAALRDEAEYWRGQNTEKATALFGWARKYEDRAFEIERCLGNESK